MSDLSSVDSVRQQLEANRAPKIGVVGRAQAPEDETNLFEDSLYYVGKPEEWLVKLIGSVFSDDPKYRSDSSSIYDQASFFDIAQDVTGGESTTANLLVNMPLGLAAAVLNPLDPLNVASVAKLTKAGTFGRMATRATMTSKGFAQIDAVGQLEVLRKGLGYGGPGGVAKLAKDVELGIKPAKTAAKSIKRFEKQMPALQKANEWLEMMQKEKGIPIEDLVEKKTFFERVRSGQQTILGLNPYDNPIIRRLGGIPREDRAARSAIKIKPLDAVLDATLQPFMRAGTKAKELATAGLNKMLPAGAHIPDTDVKKFLAQIINKATRSTAATKNFNAEEALREYNFIGKGFDPKDVHRILDEMEDVFGGVETRLLRSIIDTKHEEIFSGIKESNRHAAEIGIKGLDLTNQQRELIGVGDVIRGVKNTDQITQSIVRAERAFRAGSFHTESVITNGDNFYLDAESIVIKLPSPKDASRLGLAAKMEELSKLDIPGLAPFASFGGGTVVMRGGAENLFASSSILRRLHKTLAASADRDGYYLVTSNLGVSPGAQWTNVHLENLEKISAIMAKKGYFFKDLSPSKVMIGASGEVQIIDPTSIGRVRAKAKGGRIRNAARMSRNTMRNKLFGKIGATEDFQFSILGSDDAAFRLDAVKETKAIDLHFQDLSPNAKKLTGDDTVRFFNVEDLLQSHNAGYAKVLDEETIQGLGIDLIANEMDQAGVMQPIKIRVDDRGQVYISEGLERLAAARHLGLEAVPVIREDYIGDITRATLPESLPRGATQSAVDVMSSKPASYDALAAQVREQLPHDMRILDEMNRPIAVRDSAFEALDESDILYQMAQWFSRRFSQDQGVQRMRPSWFSDSERAFLDAIGVDGKIENSRAAFLRLEELVKQSNDPLELIGHVSPELRLPHGTAETAQRGPLASDFAIMRGELQVMKERFKELTEALNNSGVFTKASKLSAVGDYTARTGRTIIRTTDEGLEFTNLAKSAEELTEIAKGYVRQQAPNLTGAARVDIFGTSPIALRASSLLEARPASAIGPLLPADLTFFASPKTKSLLAKKKIFIDPDQTILQSHGVRDTVGRLTTKPNGVFAYSMSGSLIFAPTHTSVDKLMTDLFGQAPRSMQEYGVFAKDGVQISNVLGMKAMQRLTHGELEVVERRMKELAKKLEKAGFDNKMQLGFQTPFSEDVWDQIYRKDSTIGDVTSKDFKMDLPDNLKGTTLNLYDERGAVAISDRSLNMPEGPIRHLFSWVEKNLDETALRELEAGLPINVRAGYFPRFMTPELLVKLDELGQVMFSGKGKKEHFNYWIQNFKGRKLSDLTTREVNKLFKDLQLSSEDIAAFDKLHGSKFMRSLAEVDPKAATFFMEDPILATTMRRDLSAKAIANKAAYDALTDPGNGIVVWKGDIDTYIQRQGVEGNTLKQWERFDTLSDRIAELQQERRAALADPAGVDQAIIDGFDDQLSKLDVQADEIFDQAMAGENFQMHQGFPLQGEIDPNFGIVSVDRAWASDAVSRGLLTEDDFVAGNWASPYMKIQTKTMARKGIKGVEMTVFTREAMDFMDNYFGLLSNQGGVWDNFLTKFFDPLNRLFKETTLFLPPAVFPYSVRNFFSNVLLGWLGKVDVDSYSKAFKGLKTINNYNRGRIPLAQAEALLRNEIHVNAFGDTSNLFDIWGAFVHEGGLSGGLHINEFIPTSDAVLRESVKRGLTPASNLISGSIIFDNKLLEAGRSFSGMLENNFRFAAFYDAWKKGGSFEDAAINVKKLFYNYDELNLFERRVLKRVVPFYSWMRFNTPRMLETMATDPVKHYRIKSAVDDIERGAGGPATEEELPSWLSDRWAITIGRENGKLVIATGDFLLPMADVRRLVSGPTGAAQFVVDGLTPFLKYPAEQLFNRSLFSSRISDLFHGEGRPIERVPGEPARSGVLRGLGFSRRANPFEGPLGAMNLLMNESLVTNVRAVNWIVTWLDWQWDNTNIREEAPTLQARLLDAFFARAYTIDPERYHSIMQLEADKWIRRFQWAEKDAIKRGDSELSDYYRSRITDAATRK
tara:strand:+ start:8328 stop:14462 length:6135 start_codon:yes stop_codon:yes gene_type:complete